jgi:hypothetical protein
MAQRGPVDVTKMIEDELLELEEEPHTHEAPTVPAVNVEIDAMALEIDDAPATRPLPLPIRDELLAKSDPRRESDNPPADAHTTLPPPPGYSPAELAADPKSKK